MKNYELYHHGILGQKWGVRRFQNEDGSLTGAGRKRYGVGQQRKLAKKLQKYANKGETENAVKLVSTHIENSKYKNVIKALLKKQDEKKTAWFTSQNKLADAWDDAAIRLRNIVDDGMKECGLDPNDELHRLFWEDEIITNDPKYKVIDEQNEKAFQNLKDVNKEVCDALFGEYGNLPVKDIDNKLVKNVSEYVTHKLLYKIDDF